jgi:hypothetical protein
MARRIVTTHAQPTLRGGKTHCQRSVKTSSAPQKVWGADDANVEFGLRRYRVEDQAPKGAVHNQTNRKVEGSTGRAPRKRELPVWRNNAANPMAKPDGNREERPLTSLAWSLGGEGCEARRMRRVFSPRASARIAWKFLRIVPKLAQAFDRKLFSDQDLYRGSRIGGSRRGFRVVSGGVSDRVSDRVSGAPLGTVIRPRAQASPESVALDPHGRDRQASCCLPPATRRRGRLRTCARS